MKCNFLNENENKGKKRNKNTISPRKSRKSHNKKMNKEFGLELRETQKKKSKKLQKSSKKTKDKTSAFDYESKVDSSNNINKKNNIIIGKLNKESNSSIYKFIIDDVNETEDNFQNQLKNELIKVENENNNSEKDWDKKETKQRKSINKKNHSYKKPKRVNSLIVSKHKKPQDIFMFSEINKKLMIEDGLELSSIEENNIITTQNNNVNKKKINRGHGSIQISNKSIKKKIHQKMYGEDNSKIEQFSDKESIISILSEMM